MTPSIRVVVANQPRLMRELVLVAIIEQPDIEVVGEIKDEDEIVDAVERMHPEFLIIALNESNQRPFLCDTLLRRYPEMKILALAPERNCSIFNGLRSIFTKRRWKLSEVGILNTLRSKGLCVGGYTCVWEPISFSIASGQRRGEAYLSSPDSCSWLCGHAPEVRAQQRNNNTTNASDLALQNFSRVAGTAAEIKTVLLNDAGLMIALKTLGCKGCNRPRPDR